MTDWRALGAAAKAIALLVVLLVVAGCGSLVVSRGDAGGRGSNDRPAAGASRPVAGETGGHKGGSSATDGDGSGRGAAGTTSGKAGASCVNDTASDLEGQGQRPRYADVVTACVRNVSGGIRLELAVGGDLPQRMPDGNTSMAVGFDLSGSSGGHTSVFAEADNLGWTVYHSDGQGRRKLTGRLVIRDRTMRMVVKSAELPQMSRLNWKAETSWTRSTLTSTAYAFDAAPNHGHATFRR